ncbi:MAG: Bax inhibitor-1/YccA family protein [Sphingomonadaceae bacterium]|uniref:Bax inhibitor-1/YccA family protein n=1 Tax=Thermaurantiacus sp. TaxID=2820283 RepID=UPI00298F2C42|nr:Bax inhibitor-1/YccA family protein [Thermaurantiacus sp.]MCS6987244.1 Bax inhibitor-1/YccA family protein [Sphingomonadaceae bacterium]MDW8414464.1 Bax inhibitor-1/YccA family protein [Thermaurantiacus sp.]
MVDRVDPRLAARAAFGRTGAVEARYDEGLRAYMLQVYNYMVSGVLLSGLVALAMNMTGAVRLLFSATGAPSLLGWAVMLSPLAIVFLLGFRVGRMSEGAAQAAFWGFAILMGMSLSTIFLRYTGTSIATTFFATAAAFAGLSLWGYTTKRNLSGFGTFLVMGVVGLLVAMLLNLWLQSGALALVISIVGVLVFAGLTAYDTQRIKEMYDWVAGTEMAGKSAIMGALQLYLDFINMFQFLLNFLGQRE